MTDPCEYLAPSDDPGATPAQKVAALAVLASLHPTRLEHLDTDGETETWNATFERDAWVEFCTNPQRTWILAFKAHSLDEARALLAWAQQQRYGQLTET